MTRQEYHYVDTENEVLRNTLRDLRSGASDLVRTVERYLRQECLRSELCTVKDRLKKLLNR